MGSAPPLISVPHSDPKHAKSPFLRVSPSQSRMLVTYRIAFHCSALPISIPFCGRAQLCIYACMNIEHMYAHVQLSYINAFPTYQLRAKRLWIWCGSDPAIPSQNAPKC